MLNLKEIALLELLRVPDVYVEAGSGALVARVRDALALSEVREEALRAAVIGERNVTTRESFDKLVVDLALD